VVVSAVGRVRERKTCVDIIVRAEVGKVRGRREREETPNEEGRSFNVAESASPSSRFDIAMLQKQ
jgi:hypothetical protein